MDNGINGNTNVISAGVWCGTYEGKNVWYLSSRKQIVKINPTTGTLTGYNLPTDTVYQSMVFDGTYIWLAPYSGDYILRRMNPDTMEFKEYFTGMTNSPVYSVVYDGENLWMTTQYQKAYKFNTTTKELQEISHWPDNTSSVKDSTFDGRYVWMATNSGDCVTRIDTQTNEVLNHNITGTNIGSWNSNVTGKSYSLTFDGKSVWLIPGCVDRMLKISSTIDTHCINEYFVTEGGDEIKTPRAHWLDQGERYEKQAAEISGFTCVGYRIDGGDLQSATTAHIDNVQSGYTVTFVYQEDGSLPGVTIVHQYQSDTGLTLQPDTINHITLGQEYTATAPVIEGYTCIGHSVDGGELLSSATATIQDVQSSHFITFIYKKDDDGGVTEPIDGKCCCGSLKLELNIPIINNKEMLQELTNLVAVAKGCEQPDCQ